MVNEKYYRNFEGYACDMVTDSFSGQNVILSNEDYLFLLFYAVGTSKLNSLVDVQCSVLICVEVTVELHHLYILKTGYCLTSLIANHFICHTVFISAVL